MKFNSATSIFTVVALVQLGQAAHGDGAEGTVMGPVAFLWPDDRPWSAAYDNIGPCGSNSSVSNRTEFPLGSIGSIELTIADEAYNLAVRIAYGNDPRNQDSFQAIKNNVSVLDPGHQCYPVPTEPNTVAAGSNATIQLEYWADDSTKNESFFACADITFVEASAFTEPVLCFNVTASEFDSPSSATPSSTATSTSQVTPSAAATNKTNMGSGELSNGAKAGIAVGCIVGAALILAASFFALRLKRRGGKDTEDVVAAIKQKNSVGNDGVSIMSGKTVS